jgi:tRNA modification GTPase
VEQGRLAGAARRTAVPGRCQAGAWHRRAADLDALRDRIKQRAGYEQAGEGAWSARARHLDALRRAGDHATRAKQQLERRTSFELVAEELRLAQRALGEITGEVTSDELLGRIFSDFCIGK